MSMARRLGLILLPVLLGGCVTTVRPGSGAAPASPATAGSSTPADLPTASDEGDIRKRSRIRLELASGYFEQGQTTVALDELKQVLQIDPNLPEAHNLRGLIYMRLGDLRLAEDGFRRAYTLNPADANVSHNYGWLLCQQGRYGESETFFAQALTSAVYPDKAKTWMTQGICQMRAGQTDAAERSLARANELDPGNPVAAYNLARLLYARGDARRAQFYIRRLNNSELANAETLWLGIRVERRLGDRDAFQQLSDQLNKRFPRSREAIALERGAFDE